MSRQDLIPLNMRTKEEQKAIAKKGGLASGKARREKKVGKELARLMLRSLVYDENEIADFCKKYGVDTEITQEAIIYANMIEMAKKNPTAFENLMKYLDLYIERVENQGHFDSLEKWKEYINSLNRC